MIFDAEIVLKVSLGPPTLSSGDKAHPVSTAWGHITMRADDTHKRWHVHGAHDHRFPGTGPLWLRFVRSTTRPNNVLLLNKHGHEWAELEDFPIAPNPSSKGTAYFSNLNYPPCGFTTSKKWYGDWYVNNHVRQRNIPAFDPNEGAFAQMLHTCSRDTGFQYDTSSGVGFAGGAGLGAGVSHQQLVIKRKDPHDKRRWVLSITASGVGLMTPGAGPTGSAEAAPSGALTDILAGPNMRMPVHPNDFTGSVMFFDAGGGAAVGKGVHAGVGGSTTTFLFVGGVNSDRWYLPDITTIRAAFQTWSTAGSGSRSTGVASAGAAGMVYGGVCTSVTQRG